MASKKLHLWTPEEDDLLIRCSVEIHEEGALMGPLWLKQVELRLNEMLPGHEIKVLDIKSRMKTIKQHWLMIYEVVYSANNPGFGWDPNQKCVTGEVEVWDEYINTNMKAAMIHSKSFPYFKVLTKIFFGDETSTTELQVYCDVVEEFEVLYDELLKVDGINDKERHSAYLKLVKDIVLVAEFINLPYGAKEEVVRQLIS